MVATSNFSGFISSDCALASALAIAPIDSLERCMVALRSDKLKTDSARFRPLGPHPMPDRLPSIFGHQCLQGGLGILMFQERRAGPPEYAGKLRPCWLRK